MKSLQQQLRDGFTLVEMLVIAPIVILAIGAFVTVVISMVGEVLTSRASNSLSYDVQDAMNRIEQDVKLSTTFLAQNNVTLVAGNAQGYDDNIANFTNVGGTSGTSLILNMLTTSGNPLSTSSAVVYLANQPASCVGSGADVYTSYSRNVPMTHNVVYFVKNGSLWRRTIMPSNYDTVSARCGAAAPWQQPSCAPSYSATFCKTEDIRLVDGVPAGGFFVRYYNAAESTVPDETASNSNDTVANRNTALQASPTVSVSVNATGTVAGRTIERSATLRATRLDINASSIAVPNTPTSAPASPNVTAATTAPTNVVFTWPSVNDAASYTIQYRINGGSWVTGFTNQNTRTYTVSSATHTNTVEASVTANNVAGSSTAGTATATIPLWTSLDLVNGWAAYPPPFAVPAYTKTSTGLVFLKGMVRGGSGAIATLPSGYRPGTSEYIMFESSANQAFARVDIVTSGQISMSVGTNPWLSLDGIAFMPSGTTFTALTGFLNGWTNYSPSSGDTNWAQAGYYQDSAGRVVTRGLVRAGTATAGTPIVTVPAGVNSPQYNHVANVNSNANGHISYNLTNNSVNAKGGSNVYVAINAIYFTSARATGTDCLTQWCALPLVNSWVHYGSPYTTPQYTQASDGVVHLKGLIRSGTAATMATLPADYCPKETLLFTTVAADAWSRVDISAGTGSGCSVVGSAYSTTWTSLDSIRFIGDYQ